MEMSHDSWASAGLQRVPQKLSRLTNVRLINAFSVHVMQAWERKFIYYSVNTWFATWLKT